MPPSSLCGMRNTGNCWQIRNNLETAEISIREIRPEETYPIRHEILRPGRPLKEVQFEGDFEPTTFHLGAFLQEKLVGIATYVKNPHKDFEPTEQYQLRGMAVLPEVQKMHLGQRILLAGETILREKKNTRFLWCNARETAVDFYRKNNYQTHGDYFEIPNVCTHIVMYKRL